MIIYTFAQCFFYAIINYGSKIQSIFADPWALYYPDMVLTPQKEEQRRRLLTTERAALRAYGNHPKHLARGKRNVLVWPLWSHECHPWGQRCRNRWSPRSSRTQSTRSASSDHAPRPSTRLQSYGDQEEMLCRWCQSPCTIISRINRIYTITIIMFRRYIITIRDIGFITLQFHTFWRYAIT